MTKDDLWYFLYSISAFSKFVNKNSEGELEFREPLDDTDFPEDISIVTKRVFLTFTNIW